MLSLIFAGTPRVKDGLLPSVVDATFQYGNNNVLQVGGRVIHIWLKIGSKKPMLSFAGQVSGSLRTGAVEQLVLGIVLTLRCHKVKHSRDVLYVLGWLGDENRDEMSIVDGIVQTVKEAPLDVRAALLANMLFVGGTAMIPGKANATSTSHSLLTPFNRSVRFGPAFDRRST